MLVNLLEPSGYDPFDRISFTLLGFPSFRKQGLLFAISSFVTSHCGVSVLGGGSIGLNSISFWLLLFFEPSGYDPIERFFFTLLGSPIFGSAGFVPSSFQEEDGGPSRFP